MKDLASSRTITPQSLKITTLALCILIARPLAAEDSKAIEDSLNKSMVGNVLILRHSNQGLNMKFGPDGALVSKAEPGAWTLYGGIKVDKMRLRNNTLKIDGNRMYMVYDQKIKHFADLRGDKVAIEVDLGAPAPSVETITDVLKKIFLKPGESLADFEPPYWKRFLDAYSNGKEVGDDYPPSSEGAKVYKDKDDHVTSPKEIYAPSPDYSREASHAGCHGSLVISFVVDAKGNPKNLSIVKPLGMGLDDNAVSTIENWKFKPGERNGVPVEVRVMVEVTFNMSPPWPIPFNGVLH